MTKKRKNKNILISQEAYRILKRRYEGLIPHNPIIIKDKIFVSTADSENKKGDKINKGEKQSILHDSKN